MVVVVILGILAAILVPKVMDRPDQARITKARQDIRALEAALNLYKLDNYVYPTTDQGLEAPLVGTHGAGLVEVAEQLALGEEEHVMAVASRARVFVALYWR